MIENKIQVDVIKAWTCPECGVDTCFEQHALGCTIGEGARYE